MAQGSRFGAPVGFSESQTDQHSPDRFRIVADGVVEDGATGIRRNVPNIKMGHAGEKALATLDRGNHEIDQRSDLRNGQGRRPTRLQVVSIGVTTDVVPIGIDENGALVVPQRSDITGWWSGGSSPGEKGPTVIVGHYDSKTSAGVFERLKDTKEGARILVEQSDRSVFTYEVILVERLSKTMFPTQSVYGPTNASTLRLVTCGGKFDRATGHYVDNTIVYADLISVDETKTGAYPQKISPFPWVDASTTSSTTTSSTTTSTTSTTSSTSTTSTSTTTTSATPTTIRPTVIRPTTIGLTTITATSTPGESKPNSATTTALGGFGPTDATTTTSPPPSSIDSIVPPTSPISTPSESTVSAPA